MRKGRKKRRKNRKEGRKENVLCRSSYCICLGSLDSNLVFNFQYVNFCLGISPECCWWLRAPRLGSQGAIFSLQGLCSLPIKGFIPKPFDILPSHNMKAKACTYVPHQKIAYTPGAFYLRAFQDGSLSLHECSKLWRSLAHILMLESDPHECFQNRETAAMI